MADEKQAALALDPGAEAGKTTEATAEAGKAVVEAGKTEAAKTDPGTGKTILDGTADTPEKQAQTDKAASVTVAWPADWREKLAGGDEKKLATLKRYTSLETWNAAAFAARAKISSGDFKQTLPDDASPEEIAAYRKDHGIPETPEGYFEKLPDGLVIGEDDKAVMSDFLADMHAGNERPETVGRAIAWYYKRYEAQLAETQKADDANWATAEEELRAEWGPDFRGNRNALIGFLDTLPGGQQTRDAIMGARMADGRKVGASVDVLKGLAQWALEINPGSTVAPGSGISSGKAIGDEIASIEKLMADGKSEYWTGPGADKMQARYRDLLDARDKQKARAA
jgi:hypothetical protein